VRVGVENPIPKSALALGRLQTVASLCLSIAIARAIFLLRQDFQYSLVLP
jgi:hypothetical protein